MATWEELVGPRPGDEDGVDGNAGVVDVRERISERDSYALAPMVRESLGKLSALLPKQDPLTTTEEELGGNVNMSGDVPIGTFWKYYTLPEAERNQFLVEKYGKGNVAKSATGEMLVKQQNAETGVDEWTPLSGEDKGFLYNAGRIASPRSAAEVIGAGAGLFATKGLGGVTKAGKAASWLGKSAVSATGAEVFGGAAEKMAGAKDNAEIIKRRAANIPLGMIMDGVFTSGIRLASTVASPFHVGGDLTIDGNRAIEAANKVMESYGLPHRFKPTLGEATGNKEFLGIERFSEEMPGAQSVFTKIQDEQNEVVRALQKIAMGQDPRMRSVDVPNVELVGSDTIQAVVDSVKPFKDAVSTARISARTAVGEEATQAAVATTTRPDPVTSEHAGRILRESLLAMRKQWKDGSGMDSFYTEPWATAMDVPVGGLSSRLKAIRDELASVVRTEKKQSPILGPTGTPISEDVTRKVLLKKWLPSGVMDRIDEIADNPNDLISLENLRKMRSDLDDDIVVGQALPGQGTRHLRQIRQAITDEMESVIEKRGGPEALSRWKGMNEAYRQNAEKFEQDGIVQLFKDKSQAGAYVPDGEIVTRVLNNPAYYDAYESVFGQASEPMQYLRRSVADRVIQGSTGRLSDVVNATEFSKNLKALWDKNPKLAASTFGAKSKDLYRLSEAVAATEKDPYIDLSEVADLLSDGSRPTVAAIKGLVEKQRALDMELTNDLKKSIAGGPLPSVKPHRIVDRLLNDKNLTNREVEQVMEIIRKDENLARQVKTLAFMDIFMRASKASRVSDNASILRGDLPLLEVTELRKQIGLEGVGAVGRQRGIRLSSIVGLDGMHQAQELTKLLAPREMKREISATGGSMAVGSERGKLLSTGIKDKFSYGISKAHAWILAGAINNKLLRAWASNSILAPESTGRNLLYTVAMTTGPLASDTLQVWGPEKAQEYFATIKSEIDSVQRENARSEIMSEQDDSIADIEQLLGPRP